MWWEVELLDLLVDIQEVIILLLGFIREVLLPVTLVVGRVGDFLVYLLVLVLEVILVLPIRSLV